MSLASNEELLGEVSRGHIYSLYHNLHCLNLNFFLAIQPVGVVRIPRYIVNFLYLMFISALFHFRSLYVIHAPNVIRTDTAESVSIAVQGVATPVEVQVYIQDYPNRKKTLCQKEVEVKPGNVNL